MNAMPARPSARSIAARQQASVCYRAAHIPGAVHLHDRNVQEFVAGADKDREVILCCYHGNSSFGAVADFLENGFKNVAGMSGGFEAWRKV